MNVFLIIILFISLAILNIYDGYSTWFLMTHHNVQEMNPFMNYLMEMIGVAPTVLVVKSFFLILLLYAWLQYRIDHKTSNLKKNIVMFSSLGILNLYYITFMYFYNYQMMKAVG